MIVEESASTERGPLAGVAGFGYAAPQQFYVELTKLEWPSPRPSRCSCAMT
ncbi:hypothetical protein AB0F17_10765 [Nonomuraea sp. NPDC026600]|uniref:hypothetical protein n=1 Tax=Nonomuraea sp. NPDC026600 TaxID=3155363 RepID=UPI0033CB1D55